MKVEKCVSGAAAAALALGLAASADAKIVTVTFAGSVISGSDQTGVFGTPGANLAGDSYTAVFTIDTSVDAYFSNDAPYVENFYGGTEYAAAHDGEPARGEVSPVSATLTIAGHTLAVPGAYWGRVWDSSWSGGASELNLEVQDQGTKGSLTYSDDLENRIFSYDHMIDTTSDFTQPFSYTVQADDSVADSNFTDSVFDNSTGAYTIKVSAALNPTSVTIVPEDPPPGVPEPATWALMILGAAMSGCAIRRRNEGMAAAA